MIFSDILKSLSPSRLDEHPLSRLYGYERSGESKAKIIDSEARVIATVIIALATNADESIETILDGILERFGSENIRNRSGKRWTRLSLLALVRPVYGGIAVSPRGIWRSSKIYPPIVSPERIKAAMRRLKTAKMAT